MKTGSEYRAIYETGISLDDICAKENVGRRIISSPTLKRLIIEAGGTIRPRRRTGADPTRFTIGGVRNWVAVLTKAKADGLSAGELAMQLKVERYRVYNASYRHQIFLRKEQDGRPATLQSTIEART